MKVNVLSQGIATAGQLVHQHMRNLGLRLRRIAAYGTESFKTDVE
jgi:hypothetical protein